jgi:hypothetical protein
MVYESFWSVQKGLQYLHKKIFEHNLIFRDKKKAQYVVEI